MGGEKSIGGEIATKAGKTIGKAEKGQLTNLVKGGKLSAKAASALVKKGGGKAVTAAFTKAYPKSPAAKAMTAPKKKAK